MKYLLEITEKDVKIEKERDINSYKIRRAARAVLFNDKNEVAYQFVSKNNYHKLPGGGIEKGESIEDALRREVREEVGSEIKDIKSLGVIIEYRSRWETLQISYCFIARTDGEIGEPNFDKFEIEEGLESHWGKLEDLIKLIRNDKPEDYMGKFIQLRDLTFLKEVVLLNNNKLKK